MAIPLSSHPDETRSALLYEMDTVSAVHWALLSVASSPMQKKAVEIRLYCVGEPFLNLSDLHLGVCFCRFGSETASVLCRLTRK